MDDKVLKIKCILCNSICVDKYKICIYDINNKLICSNYTDKNGCFNFHAENYGIYKIVVLNSKTFPQKICITTLIREKKENEIKIFFNNFVHKKTYLITLTDQNYKGLPIKGEIILCQNNM